MFPPIMNTPSDRTKQENAESPTEETSKKVTQKYDDKEEQQKAACRPKEEALKWNDYAMRRVISDLKTPGVLCGIHPEGTRNKNADPYSMLATRPGVGRVALESPDAHVIPCFIYGIESDVWGMFIKNLGEKPLAEPVDVVFGPRIDFSDLRQQLIDGGAADALYKEAGNRVSEAIAQLANAHPKYVKELRDKEEAERSQRYQGENPKELRLSQTPKEVSSISTSATDPKKEKSTPVESV